MEAKNKMVDNKLVQDEIHLRVGKTMIDYLRDVDNNWKSDGAIRGAGTNLSLEDLPIWNNENIFFIEPFIKDIKLDEILLNAMVSSDFLIIDCMDSVKN